MTGFSCRSCIWLSKHIPLQHGEVSLLTEHQMVQHLDAYDVTSLPEPSSDIPILHTWFQVAARMVVGYQDCCCTLSYCLNENFTLNVMKDTIKLLFCGIQKGNII